MKLTISGKVPSKKNSRNIFVKNGKLMNIPSQRYKEWRDSAIVQLKQQFEGYKVSGYPISISVVVYYGDKRRHDLDNSLGSVMDVLTDAQIIEDDDTDHISQITVEHGGYDKEHPRVELYLED